MPGTKAWMTDPWGSLKKVLVSNFAGAVPTLCGEQSETHHIKLGFIGNTNAKALIESLKRYNEDVVSANVSASHARDRGAINFNKKAIVLLEKYRKELVNFKKIDFFASSTLKRLELAKKHMKEILGQLKKDTESALKKYSDDSLRESALKDPELKGYVPKRIWCDFIEDMIVDIQTTSDGIDSAINLGGKPAIAFDKLQLKPVKTALGKKDIDRKKIIEGRISNKYKKDAETAKKQIGVDFKEAKKIHDKLRAFYDKLSVRRKDIENNQAVLSTESDRSHLKWKLKGLYNYCIDVCFLTGLKCCEAKDKQNPKIPGYDDYGSMLELVSQAEDKISTQDYSEVSELANKAHKKLEKIKELGKESQRSMKEINDIFKKIASTEAVPEA